MRILLIIIITLTFKKNLIKYPKKIERKCKIK